MIPDLTGPVSDVVQPDPRAARSDQPSGRRADGPFALLLAAAAPARVARLARAGLAEQVEPPEVGLDEAAPLPGQVHAVTAAGLASVPPVPPPPPGLAQARRGPPPGKAPGHGTEPSVTEPAAATGQQPARRAAPRRPGQPERVVAAPGAVPHTRAALLAAPGQPPTAPAAAAPPVAERHLATSARLLHAAQPGLALREPAEPRAARTAPAPEATTRPVAVAGQAASPAPESQLRLAPPPAARGAPVLPPEPAQGSLGGAILPNAAHLRLESEGLGDLALHLRIRDGVAHLRVEGDQAGLLVGRGQELQRALAAEGLKLGHLEAERPQVAAAPQADTSRSSLEQGEPRGQRERETAGEPAQPHRAPGTAAPARRAQVRTSDHHVEA